MHPRKIPTIEHIENVWETYVASCKEREAPLTVVGFAVALDVSRETLSQYAQGVFDNENESFSAFIRKCRDKIEADKNEGLLTGRYNSTGAIFDLKNNHGWKDRQEVDTTHSGALEIRWQK